MPISGVDLSAAITAQKALRAAAKRYREQAQDNPRPNYNAILVTRAKECEMVADALLPNVTVE